MKSRRALTCLALALWLASCGAASSAGPSESEGETAAPSEGETAAPSESETAAPSESETAAPSESETAAPSESPASPSPPRLPLALDTHVDTPQRMLDHHDDIAARMPDGHLDFPRMREGGLTGAFFSIWVDPRRYPGEAAWERAQALVATVRDEALAHPDDAALCTTVAEVRAAYASGRIAVLMGIEGAHALGDAPVPTLLERLDALHALGCRYMTLTWTNDNVFAHASTGGHPSRGLTDDGRTLVAHMNAIGMIPDVSHVSDRTFFDVLEVSTRPPFASHSATRALSPHRRNVTDAMIRAMAEHHGAICVNYYAAFVDAAYGTARRTVEREHRTDFEAIEGRSWETSAARIALVRSLAPELRPPTIETLGAHFAHVVEVGGIETACLGSDFDGAGELAGLTDATDLPLLYAELERRGLALAPILGENVLRVLAANTP